MSKTKRPWTRDHRKTQFLPEELRIAGIDYETSADDPLRDAPSKGRQRDDEVLLDLLRRGFHGAILVTSRVIDDEVRAVVVDGRRRVLLSRTVNEERIAQGLEPWRWTVTYEVVRDETAAEVARMLNRGQVPETSAQVAVYLVRLIDQGHTEESAAKLLGVPVSAVQHYRAVADPQCAFWVFEALDEGAIGLQAAATIAKLEPGEQEEIRRRLDGQKLTTAAVREAVAGTKGTRAAVPPPKRRVRAMLRDERAQENLPPDFRRGVLFMLGELKAEDVPELADLWEAEG